MAKDFNVSLKELVGQYRSNAEPGFRYSVVSELRTLADYIAKSDPWPAEIKASEEAQKKGLASISEPTEAEMKRAAADEEAAKLARMRGISDDYTSNAEPDVPQSAKDEKLEREFKMFRGEEGAEDNIPGRPFPARTPYSDDVDVDKRTHADVSTDKDPTSSPASRREAAKTPEERAADAKKR
jgi:hypothetical protein